MNVISSRPYRPADRPACPRLFGSNGPEVFAPGERPGFEAFLDAHGGTYRVVEAAGRPSACGGWVREPDGVTASLCWGMVDAGAHRRGLGSYLNEARIESARDGGALVLRLDTGTRAVGFYERLGFKVEGVTPAGYAPGYDRIDMRLDLRT